jgi:DNA invertase Pin-like site-specific DNA recombinase
MGAVMNPTTIRAYSYARMSTDIQLKGDSLRRQLEQSRAYAVEHGLALVEADQLKDIGISAFDGANVTDGALGRFLKAVRHHEIDAGSFLLVESLDRLSRQEVLKSLGLFIEIINAKINIVTLADRRVYTAETDFSDLIFSIASMSRAHDESRIKSHRLTAAWANKRKNAHARKLTAQCPAWLKLSVDKLTFALIQDRIAVISTIFEDSANGIGNYSITRRLNLAAIPPFGRAAGWHSSSVAKILSNRALLGEFQPHRLVNGKRVPDGGPIADYFPKVIDEQLFYRAQNARNERHTHGGGRKGEYISNLFSGIAICAYCRSRMRFENKGVGPKGGSYLVCNSARRGLGCQNSGWRYDHFEASFLAFVRELDLESIIRGEDEAQKRADLANVITSLAGQCAGQEGEREKIFQLLEQSGASAEFVGKKLDECEQRLVLVRDLLEKKRKEYASLNSDIGSFYESKEKIKNLINRLQKRDSDDVYVLRAQIAAKLRALVENVIVAPVGEAPQLRQTIDLVKANVPDRVDLISEFESRFSDERTYRRYFAIGFKDKGVRGVYPSADDPLQFEEQVFETQVDFRRLNKLGEENVFLRKSVPREDDNRSRIKVPSGCQGR